jgi:protein-S-isoprenylcysteine O-methyltransferase Ste14
MRRQTAAAVYVVALIAIVVVVDILFLKNLFWARLAVNIGIVLVFGALYFWFFRRSGRD